MTQKQRLPLTESNNNFSFSLNIINWDFLSHHWQDMCWSILSHTKVDRFRINECTLIDTETTDLTCS